MTCVVDASVALKWFLPDEPHSDEAWALVQEGEILIAPDLLIAETCNAAWKCHRLERMEASEVSDIAAILPRFFAELVGTASLAPRAALIAVDLAHPVYDCLYLALAESRRLPFVT
ncbi:MAG TPA: type II toxin-antitoxin system VapC family toxin, partial [Stellaceae bacterium]|nr:type II toxin-antitoxin system VapC family toxin [Stellaceae bacterium]